MLSIMPLRIWLIAVLVLLGFVGELSAEPGSDVLIVKKTVGCNFLLMLF